MKVDQNIANLVFEIEQIIASECYNKHSVNGWTGVEECEFRYPVHVRRKASDDKKDKCWSKIRGDEHAPETMYYQFGANQMFIGKGIVKLLEMLEDRYGIDFNELETKYLSVYPKDLEFAKSLLLGTHVEYFGEEGVVTNVCFDDDDGFEVIRFDVDFVADDNYFFYPEDLLNGSVTVLYR